MPQIAKKIATTMPRMPWLCSTKAQARNAGAMPNEPRSQSESISLPISLATPKKRAVRPSSPSATSASRMKIEPQTRLPLYVERIEHMPKTRFDEVHIFGINLR